MNNIAACLKIQINDDLPVLRAIIDSDFTDRPYLAELVTDIHHVSIFAILTEFFVGSTNWADLKADVINITPRNDPISVGAVINTKSNALHPEDGTSLVCFNDEYLRYVFANSFMPVNYPNGLPAWQALINSAEIDTLVPLVQEWNKNFPYVISNSEATIKILPCDNYDIAKVVEELTYYPEFDGQLVDLFEKAIPLLDNNVDFLNDSGLAPATNTGDYIEFVANNALVLGPPRPPLETSFVFTSEFYGIPVSEEFPPIIMDDNSELPLLLRYTPSFMDDEIRYTPSSFMDDENSYWELRRNGRPFISSDNLDDFEGDIVYISREGDIDIRLIGNGKVNTYEFIGGGERLVLSLDMFAFGGPGPGGPIGPGPGGPIMATGGPQIATYNIDGGNGNGPQIATYNIDGGEEVVPDLPLLGKVTVHTFSQEIAQPKFELPFIDLTVPNILPRCVTSTAYMFSSSFLFNQNLNSWDMSNIDDISGMFSGCYMFNQPLNNWDVSNVTDMETTFAECYSFNQPLNNWDVSNVTDMYYIFNSASSFNQPLNNWDVSNVTDMDCMFKGCNAFNQDLSEWDTSRVTDMSQMFYETSVFNGNITTWNTSQVTNFTRMFSSARVFNQDISNWDVSNALYMGGMFDIALVFNQPIGNWDISKVTSVQDMFKNAWEFNQDLSSWNVSNVQSMNGMFFVAKTFNQDLSGWNVAHIPDEPINFANLAAAWTEPKPVWGTTGNSGGGPTDEMGLRADYSGSGWYKATDTGVVYNVGVPEGETYIFDGDPTEYISVWRNEGLDLETFDGTEEEIQKLAYWHKNLHRFATSNVTDMRYWVYGYGYSEMYEQLAISPDDSNTIDISHYDTSNVTSMGFMFYVATAFNQDISSWDTSKVTDMDFMFNSATSFNQDLSSWCVSLIPTEPEGFTDPEEYDTEATAWTLPKPVWGTCPSNSDDGDGSDSDMGLRADYSGTGWYKATDTGVVYNKGVPEGETYIFDGDPTEYISVWRNGGMDPETFEGAEEDIQKIVYWHNNLHRFATSNVTDMSYWMYVYGSRELYEHLGISPDDINTNSFDISHYDTSNVTSMGFMFYDATAFNQDISSWNVSKVTNMDYMFIGATSFNQDLSSWCVSLIPTEPEGFDLPVSAWTLPKPVWGTCPRGEDGGSGGTDSGGSETLVCNPTSVTITRPIDEFGSSGIQMRYVFEGREWDAALTLYGSDAEFGATLLGRSWNPPPGKSRDGIAVLTGEINGGVATFTVSGIDAEGNFEDGKNYFTDLVQRTSGLDPNNVTLIPKAGKIQIIKADIPDEGDFFTYTTAEQREFAVCSEVSIARPDY